MNNETKTKIRKLAHDLNNQLGIILGHASEIQDVMHSGLETYKDINLVIETAMETREISRQLFAVVKKADDEAGEDKDPLGG